jgi:PiT family inorganic phosphate transporter
MPTTWKVAAACLAGGVVVPAVVQSQRDALPSLLGPWPELTLLGILGCLIVAMANGANDIANSVGTSYGAGALSLQQAIAFGAAAEFMGAVSLGSFVAQSISKGLIDPATFLTAGCHGELQYGLVMLGVLAGTGSTTLLATLYGLPISASHGVVGGLFALGLFTRGAQSLATGPLVATAVAWVASPLLGGLTSGVVHALLRSGVHEAREPATAADRLQPLLVALTVSVAAAFVLVAGPSAIRLHPQSRAVGASCALGITVALASAVWRSFARRSAVATLHAHVRVATTSTGAAADETTAASPDSALDHDQPDADEGELTLMPSPHAVEEPFVPLLVLSALTVAFAHGANDLGNSIGPLAAILVVEARGNISAPPEIPPWLLMLGAGGFVVGIVLLGRRTIETVGDKITKLTPSRAFAVQIGTAMAVLASTVLGLAVSTSHCLVGSIVGVGICERLRGGIDADLNSAMLLKIIGGWAATIPLAMAISVLAYVAAVPGYIPDARVCDLSGTSIPQWTSLGSSD